MDPTRCIAAETAALFSFGCLKAEDANDERLARELTADYDDISDSVGLSLTMLESLYHSTILWNMHVLVLKSLT